MSKEKDFREWCNKHDFAELEEREGYENQLTCGRRVIFDKESGKVSGNLEAINFHADDFEVNGEKLELTDAWWTDMDGPHGGEGSLTVRPMQSAFDNHEPSNFTLVGWK